MDSGSRVEYIIKGEYSDTANNNIVCKKHVGDSETGYIKNEERGD